MEYRRPRGAGKAGVAHPEMERGERSPVPPSSRRAVPKGIPSPPGRGYAAPEGGSVTEPPSRRAYARTTPDNPTSFPCPPVRSTPRLSNTSGASLSTSW